MSAVATLPVSRESSNYDEVSMQQSLLFSDSLKDLKNLKAQLYSAAEYFELSYTNDEQKQIVVETLKDYAIKALVNTVDHLGSVTYKVSDFLDEKVDEVSGTALRVSCIEQRLRKSQEFMDHEGRSQQSLMINAPKFHKRYILPAGEMVTGDSLSKLKYAGCSLDDEDDWNQLRNAVRATIQETSPPPPPPPVSGKPTSQTPSPRQPQRSATFSFTSTVPKTQQDKNRTVSPHRFPLLRSGSVAIRTSSISRPTTPSKSRSITPKRYPSEPRRSASVRITFEKEHKKETEQQPSKGKRLLKALLSRRKTKKDDMLYNYLDEY
ncbi:PREDICTED: protein ABIL2-like [Tarenaya hassleriana]|uniref:protein ABIL2-like n=1 Tax=Tarenaya hassleriana TaxID=28532 RepID=UPI00053C1E83|nr:PREDICTED: protein ABIL2-like [Tarenaya hassleriana]XP_010519447.1 PREDICTED: protein ABIL2-like [Tarenaya hassleriana]XP_010519448.1 PREDICTED: protein ABIL2-like [Tarenaya hassleriana]XP_010519449.1 PREDICTED: protein ABIL2-like [Tarenaya hassleriana]XP_010519450.1 PREDICTED: protein ABIL2-like [Tarenaya hassleriana]